MAAMRDLYRYIGTMRDSYRLFFIGKTGVIAAQDPGITYCCYCNPDVDFCCETLFDSFAFQ